MSRHLQWATIQLLAVAGLWSAAGAANAQCASCGVPAVAYQPVAYQTYYSGYSGWYPGYWLNRWTRPRTYAVSYPTTYAVRYPTTYAASYPATYSAGYASYSSCSTCYSNPCCCGTQSVVMRPATCCNPCASCTTCGCDPCCCATNVVSQATYDSAGSNCAGCSVPLDQSSSTPSTFSAEPQPTLAPEENPREERFRSDTSEETSALDRPPRTTRESKASVNLEPPALFNPRDRVTARPATPVRTAVYERPVSQSAESHPAIYTAVNRAQALRDASGWNSADK